MSAETPPQSGSSQSGAPHFGARVAGAFAATLALAVAPSALAQSKDSPLAQGLLDLPANDRPAAERYQTPDGRVRFVLDRSGARLALVRFEGSDEVHVLRSVPGPRGDEFFKTDTGDVLLRVTALGSVIVYTDAARTGAPAALAGSAGPVPPPPSLAQASFQARMDALQREAARRGRPVTFVAPQNMQGPASGVVADAAARAAEGLAAAPPQGMIVRRVVIRYGAQPGAYVVNESLTVTVAPQMGYAGRPSAAAIEQALRAPRRATPNTNGAIEGPPQ
ncbi:MAG: DUF4908 domain-containing protein [Hyphomonadaceae bacterium]|nr:DUF4908 domain-containing protein [Hyphomonadaceae bacterium]